MLRHQKTESDVTYDFPKLQRDYHVILILITLLTRKQAVCGNDQSLSVGMTTISRCSISKNNNLVLSAPRGTLPVL